MSGVCHGPVSCPNIEVAAAAAAVPAAAAAAIAAPAGTTSGVRSKMISS